MMVEQRAHVEVARDVMRPVLVVTRVALYWGQNGLLLLLFRKAELGVETSGWSG